MVATVPTVEIYAGDTAIWPTYTFKDDTNSPRNLALEGWNTWTAQWRANATDTAFIDLSVDDSNSINGALRISASGAKTAAMGSNGVWDLQALNGEDTKTWVRGKTKWIEDVTRV